MAKFVAIDAHAYQTLFSNGSVVMIKTACKKFGDVSKSTQKQHLVNQDQQHSDQNLIETAQCPTPFYLALNYWQLNHSEHITFSDDHFPSKLYYRYLESVSPPPREA